MAGIQDFLRNNSSAFLQGGIGLLSGRNAQEQAAMGFQGAGNALQANKTIKFLEATNPELAQAVKSGALTGSDAFKLAYQQKLEAQKPKKPNLMSAGGSLYNSDTGQWITPPQGAGNDAEYGLNPQYGVDANGNPTIIQLSKAGTSKQTQLPDGITLSKEPIKLDAGTEFILLDPITRQPVGRIPKDLAGAERQKEVGTAQGKAEATAPQDLQSGQNALDIVTSIRNDPYKSRGTGFTALGNAIPGTGGYDFQNKVNQAKSGAFLTAIQQMRGLGALSNSEGGAATAAVNRMNTSTSEEEFDAALDDYEKIVKQGMARAQKRMQTGGSAPAAQPTGNRTSSGVQWSVEP